MLTVAGSSTRRHPKAHARKKASGRVSCKCSISSISGFSPSSLDSVGLGSPELLVVEGASLVKREGSEGCSVVTGTTDEGLGWPSCWGIGATGGGCDGRGGAAGLVVRVLLEGITIDEAGFSPSSGAIFAARK